MQHACIWTRLLTAPFRARAFLEMKVTAFLPGVCGLALLLLLPFNGGCALLDLDPLVFFFSFRSLMVPCIAAGVESRGPLGGYHWYTMFMFGDSFADTGNLPRTNCRSSLSRQWHYPYGTFNGSRSGNPLGRFSNYLVQPDIIGTCPLQLAHTVLFIYLQTKMLCMNRALMSAMHAP